MIRSFRDRVAQGIFNDMNPGKGFPPDLVRVARRKLQMLHAAASLEDLRVPPNNKLEALKRDRRGQHSIRINDQWRVCFRWKDGGAEDVEIVDYHD